MTIFEQSFLSTQVPPNERIPTCYPPALCHWEAVHKTAPRIRTGTDDWLLNTLPWKEDWSPLVDDGSLGVKIHFFKWFNLLWQSRFLVGKVGLHDLGTAGHRS